MECCICYKKKLTLITECQHHLCLNCLLKLRKSECPYCRKKINDLPIEIENIIKNNKNLNNDEPVSFGGGSLGIYWDAPGSNYYNLPSQIKDLLDELKNVDNTLWRNIRNDINNNNTGDKYNQWWLRDLIDSKRESKYMYN